MSHPRLRDPCTWRACSHLAAFLLAFAATTAHAAAWADELVRAARAQIGVTRIYDGSYQKIAFPDGDVPRVRGVCTDVVIRAYRQLGVDLQVLVHEDMKRAWAAYPKTWGLRQADPNIDHRRVPNLATFLKRHGQALPVGSDPASFRPGDIVTWQLASGVPHIGIVDAARSPRGTPLVVHNVGDGTQLEDKLFEYRLTGHYRYTPAAARPRHRASPA